MFAKTLGQVMSLDEFVRDWALVHFAPAYNRTKYEHFLHQQGVEQADLLLDQHAYQLTKKD